MFNISPQGPLMIVLFHDDGVKQQTDYLERRKWQDREKGIRIGTRNGIKGLIGPQAL